jgi:hypothetical protein
MNELVRARGRIKRVLRGMISLEFDDWATTTVRWNVPDVAIGDLVVVEGYPDRSLDDTRSGLRVCSVGLARDRETQRIELADRPKRFAKATPMALPIAAPRWVTTLVRHGLLDATGRLDPEGWTDPQTALRTRWMPREAIGRGLVHYSWYWQNDTKDPLGDLCAIGGLPPEPPLRYELESRFAEDPLGQLEAAAAVINHGLRDWSISRRIWVWDTAADWVIFLARTQPQILSLKHDGVGNDHRLRLPRLRP